MSSIIEQVRAEGYRDGVGTMATVCQDEAYESGRLAGLEQRGLHFKSWVMGILGGIAVSALWETFT